MRIVILGCGESGAGAAVLAKKLGYEVFVSDSAIISDKYRTVLQAYQIPFEEGGHTIEHILSAGQVIKSPGISNQLPIIKALYQANMPIISEIDFAGQYAKGTIIAITGSNGKSTTASLTYHFLEQQGLNVALVGNIGHSFAKCLVQDVYDYYVVELSSFQLEDIKMFKPHVACLLNISPDHLDRYDHDMALYSRTKLNIVRHLTTWDHFIYNQDDAMVAQYFLSSMTTAQLYPISLLPRKTSCRYRSVVASTSSTYVFRFNNQSFSIGKHLIPLPGLHNHYNTLASIMAAVLVGVKQEVISYALPKFRGLPHRLEWCGLLQGIPCYNDSKATNVASAAVALCSFQQPIIWIVGGKDKGNDYTMLYNIVKQNVKAIVCLGKDNKKIIQCFSPLQIPIRQTDSMLLALQHALDMACFGDIILLSPACSSFDLFDSFEDRGTQFKKAVKELNNAVSP